MAAIHLQGFSAHYRFAAIGLSRLHCNVAHNFYRVHSRAPSGPLILMLNIEFRLICICQAVVIFKTPPDGECSLVFMSVTRGCFYGCL